MNNNPKTLKVINLWGGPGSGKSTTAAALFSAMKKRGLKVELVREFAKDLTYQKDYGSLTNQLYVTGQQDHRLRSLVGQVDYAITDSPLPLALAYCGSEYKGWLEDAILGAYYRYDNYDILLTRTKEYQTYGRNQTKTEALEVDLEVRKLFRTHTLADSRVQVGTSHPDPMVILGLVAMMEKRING